MKERGIDISHHTSDIIDEFMKMEFAYVVTVCDNAKESCPYFPTTGEQFHWSFDDPAAATGTEEQKLNAFRRIRDEIESRIQQFVESKR